jgi:cysteinyl-tRNA synthetase
MRLSYAALLAVMGTRSTHTVSAFSSPATTRAVFAFVPSSSSPLRMSNDDDFSFVYDANTDSSRPSSSYGERSGGGGYRSGGGGGGRSNYSRDSNGGHDYHRDTTRDTSNVNEGVVNSLLGERLQAKKTGNFDRADAIRDQLMAEHAVGVFDKDKVWRTGCSPSGSGGGRGGGRSFDRDGGRGGGRSFDRDGGRGGGRGGGGRRRAQDFGPNGHDYEVSREAGPITSSLQEQDIHDMLAQRLQAKMSRNFDTADRIQTDLIEAGVYVHDGMKEWRADGIPFENLRGGRDGGGRDRNGPYVHSAFSEDIDGQDDALIGQLVEERSQAKLYRNYDAADSIRDRLIDEFNVHIDDKIREWSVGEKFGEEHDNKREMDRAMKTRGYLKSTSSSELASPEDEAFVQGKIDERYEAKKTGNFDLADDIRDELLAEFDVSIQDKLKQWSVGGDFGEDGSINKRGAYTRRGGGNLSEDDIAAVSSMIATRAAAKRDRDYDVADDIRTQLRDTYNIVVDDKSREWHVDSDDYVQTPSGSNAKELTDDDIETVQSKLVERAYFKREQNYEAADAIRDDLQDNFCITIDDRTKEWSVVEGSRGYDASGSQFSTTDDEFEDGFDSVFNEPGDVSEETVSSAVTLSKDDLTSLTVVQLKEKLREAGKPVSGTKPVLVERLLAC